MPARDFDVLIATDFRHAGGTTTSIAQEVEVQARMGLRTGLIQIDAPYMSGAPWSERIRALVAAGLAELVSARRPVTARLLLLRQPRVFAEDRWTLAARADHTLVIANQVPHDGASAAPYYKVAAVQARVRDELGIQPPWAPIGHTVREALRSLGAAAPELTATDWHNVIDVDAWRRPRRARRTVRPSTVVIGRHSRDDIKKWPERREELLSAYPKHPPGAMRVLGGCRAVRRLLGRVPRSWEVFPFGSMRPDEFLATLDVFVYFHHSGMREAFGRNILEALAAGLPVVTHPYFEPLFGEACAYTSPKDAWSVVEDLVREAPGAVNERGIEIARERYDWEVHRRRLLEYLGRSLPAVRRRSTCRQRVLFVSSNGGGMGHLTRLLAIARRLPDDHEPVFLTLSTGLQAVRREGFWVDYMPSAEASGLTMSAWTDHFRRRVVAAVRALGPGTIVFDGTFAYRGLINALAECPQVRAVWSRRGMWKPIPAKRERQCAEQIEAFDLILEPGELAAEVDRGFTARRRERVRALEPVVYLDREELLSREEARRELAIPMNATAGLVNLGAGNINRLDTVYQAIAELLEQTPDLHLVAARSLIAQRQLPLDRSRITPLETYPLSRVLRAFDLCVAAPGYNSFHELLAHGVPTLFIPNEETALDDQVARAEWASGRGLSLVAREKDRDGLHRALAALAQPFTREALRVACSRLPPPRGAAEAAELIAAGVERRRSATVRPEPQTWGALSHPLAVARSARRSLQPHTGRALQAVQSGASRVIPWLPPATRRDDRASPRPALVVACGERWNEDELERLVDWASAHPGGAVVLAREGAMAYLRRAGLTVELIPDHLVDDIADRLAFTEYWQAKRRELRASYRCEPVIVWSGDGGTWRDLL